VVLECAGLFGMAEGAQMRVNILEHMDEDGDIDSLVLSDTDKI
jgi:hypothetical protein